MTLAREAFCLALDVPTAAAAEAWVRRTADLVGTHKVGLQLFCAEGPGLLARLRRAGAARLFLDLKLHDIPHTVAAAVRALAGRGADLLTVHTGGGREMLAQAQAAAGPIALLGVTVLTSLDAAALVEVGEGNDPAALAARRARLAAETGLAGVVASPAEAAALRALLGPAALLVTPGIRLPGGPADDQRRIATPGAARRAGATLLVVGRPVLDAPDPLAALAALHRDWEAGPDGC